MYTALHKTNKVSTPMTDLRGKHPQFKDARKFVFRSNYREGYILSMDYNGSAVLHSVRLIPGKSGYARSKFNLSSVQLEPKYHHPIALQQSKTNDLKSLCTFMTETQRSSFALNYQ